MIGEVTLACGSFAGRTGRGVRIAIVDSGVHAAHPHVAGVSGGTAFDADGGQHDDVVDRLGHGTAVTAAIREKAPDAEILVIKVFDRSLSSTGTALVRAIDWAAAQGAVLVNLSLGTTNDRHRAALETSVARAHAAGAIVVAAAPEPSADWLPGALPGVVGVELDWDCPRDACGIRETGDGLRVRASGYPRPIPGVPPERNLKGLSFAVANATGLLALALEGSTGRTLYDLLE